jgi:type I restriction enzyme R subunit
LLLQFDQKIAQLGVAQGLDCLENQAGRGFRGFVRVQGCDDSLRQRLQRGAAGGLRNPGFVAVGQRFVEARQARGGATLKDLAHEIVAALNPDESPEAARSLVLQAVKPLCDPKLRNLLIELKKQSEQLIDTVTRDQVLEAGFSAAARERAKGVVESFERFIAEHKDEITALQILYNRPQRTQGAPLTFEALKTLADALQAPPRLWTESQLWQAYAALDKSKVKGENRRRILTDLVSLVRFAMHQDNELVPFPERVNVNFKAWLAGAASVRDKPFTEEQIKWLTMIRDHIAANLGIEADDFELSPFAQEGGIGKVHQLFGAELPVVLEAMNKELAA